MSTMDNPEAMDTDGGMGAGAADAPDIAVGDGGDATGGRSPGDPDDMGADEEHYIDGERRVDDPAGETVEPDDAVQPDLPVGASGPDEGEMPRSDRGPDSDVDTTLDGPDIQHPTNWRIS